MPPPLQVMHPLVPLQSAIPIPMQAPLEIPPLVMAPLPVPVPNDAPLTVEQKIAEIQTIDRIIPNYDERDSSRGGSMTPEPYVRPPRRPRQRSGNRLPRRPELKEGDNIPSGNHKWNSKRVNSLKAALVIDRMHIWTDINIFNRSLASVAKEAGSDLYLNYGYYVQWSYKSVSKWSKRDPNKHG